MTALLAYLEERLAERRRVAGALAECLFWAGVLSALRDRFGAVQLAHDPDDVLGDILVDLAYADDPPGDPHRLSATAALRALANHLEAGGDLPSVSAAIRFFEKESA